MYFEFVPGDKACPSLLYGHALPPFICFKYTAPVLCNSHWRNFSMQSMEGKYHYSWQIVILAKKCNKSFTRMRYNLYAREISSANSDFCFLLNRNEGTLWDYTLRWIYWFAKDQRKKSFRESRRTIDAHDPNGISFSVFHGRDWQNRTADSIWENGLYCRQG